MPNMFKEQREKPGVYSVSFSLTEFVVQCQVLVEEWPKAGQ
jgi:hypothetical protein